VSSDYTPAIWMPSPNYWAGRAGYKPQWIIIHGTAGGNGLATVNWFQQSQSGASTHYVIDQSGTVYQCVAEANTAWGNGIVQDGPGCYPPYAAGIPTADQGHGSWWDHGPNPNYQTISIEHAKWSTDNSDQLTTAQQNASFELIAHLCSKYGVPRRFADASGGITGHFSIESIDRSMCPGPYPWTELFAYLGGSMGVPAGWTDTGTNLYAPNNPIPVGTGYRLYILNNSATWSPKNTPISYEIERTPVNPAKPELGHGTYQMFRWTLVRWYSQTDQMEGVDAGQACLDAYNYLAPDPAGQQAVAQINQIKAIVNG